MTEKFRTEAELVKFVETLIGKSVEELLPESMIGNKRGKGFIGQVLEAGGFGYDLNSRQEPDIKGIDGNDYEVKSTGYKWVRNGKEVSAKERVPLTMINFHLDVYGGFKDSNVYDQIQNILFLLYEYKVDQTDLERVISNYYIYKFNDISEKDKLIIEKDWHFIIDKIKGGKAHELSEADTMYLGACPKGRNRLDTTTQPFSEEMAMRRAYSFKTKYVTDLLRTKVFHKFNSREEFIKDLDLLKDNSFEDIILNTFKPYKGKSLSDIDKILGKPVQRKGNKQFIKSYVSQMLKIEESNYNHIEEFEKADIEIKTIRLTKSKKIKESMSFPSFDFREVASEEWESSQIRDFFSSKKFLFVVFEEKNIKNQDYVFKGVKLWNMPVNDIENEVFEVWTKTHEILNGELVLKIKNNRVFNNFPGMSENRVSHVRSHGTNRKDTNPLPISTKIVVSSDDGSLTDKSYFKEHDFTKQCFWLNSSYILSVISSITQ